MNSAYFPTVDAPEVGAGTPKRIQLTLGCKPGPPTVTTIAGSRAAVFTIPPSCGGTGWAALDCVIAHAGYGYDIEETSVPSLQAQHRVVLAQILRTFKFESPRPRA